MGLRQDGFEALCNGHRTSAPICVHLKSAPLVQPNRGAVLALATPSKGALLHFARKGRIVADSLSAFRKRQLCRLSQSLLAYQ